MPSQPNNSAARDAGQSFLDQAEELLGKFNENQKDMGAAVALRNFARGLQWVGRLVNPGNPAMLAPEFAQHLALKQSEER